MKEAKLDLEAQESLLKIAHEAVLQAMKATPRRLSTIKVEHQIYVEEYEKYLLEVESFMEAAHDNREEKTRTKNSAISHRKLFLFRKEDMETLFPAPVVNQTPTTIQVTNPKTPAPQITKFTGEVRDWMSWWACYQRYHNDKTLLPMDKYQMLIQSIERDSKADKVLKMFPVCEENYTSAIDSLKNSFGRKNVIVKVYVRELLKVGWENASGKKAKLEDIATQIISKVRMLESLGVTQDMCGQILYPVVESCLPEETMEAWQRMNCDEDLKLLLDFLQKEVNRRDERNLAKNTFSDTTKPQTGKSGNGKSGAQHANKASSSPTPSTSFAATSGGRSGCVFCEKDHVPWECGKAFRMTLAEKKQILKNNNRCFRCFSKKHSTKDCQFRVTCEMCGKDHNKIMCSLLEEKSTSTTTASNSTQSGKTTRKKKETVQKKKVSFSDDSDGEDLSTTAASVDMKVTTPSSEVPLQTLTTYAFGQDGKRKRVRVMFDSGAQKSYILAPIAQELGLKKVGEEITIHQLFGGSLSPEMKHDVVKLHLGKKDGSSMGNFVVRCTPVISHHVNAPAGGPWIQQFAKKGVVFSDFGNNHEGVDILIGNDVRPHCFTGKMVKLFEGPGPVAEETLWGWVLSGKLPTSTRGEDNTMLVTNLHIADLPITDLWSLDTIGIKDSAAKEDRNEMDKKVIEHFEQTVIQHEDGRYQVGLPWLEGMRSRIPNNYLACLRRLKTTTAQLKRNGYFEKYHDVFQQWHRDKMIEIVTEEGAPQEHPAQYLPHRAVIKESSTTTPVRPVFDASAKLRGSPSLNECVDKGANTLELIPSILTRFRANKVGVTSDIKKAFQQISVNPEDREFLRFLWWEDSSCRKIRIFRHTRVVFGVSASPFLLGITLIHHLRKYRESNDCDDETSTALIKLIHDMYVDNLVTSFQSMEMAKTFQQQAVNILLPAQFDLRGWIFGPNGEDKNVPILGLLWNTKDDTLRIDISAALEKVEEDNFTQRSLLSLAHCLFDPLGLISPYVLLVKLILRDCHHLKLSWDTPVPPQIQQDVRKWSADIHKIQECHIPRHIYMEEVKQITFHVFCDASGSGYGAAVFARIETYGRVEICLIQARSRVAPQKQCTIPRLELIGCTIGVRLFASVMEDLGIKSPIVKYYTDSSVARAWIIGRGPYGVFVQNRKAEINKLTNMKDWIHIPGKWNPADLPSRGCSATKLLESRWWEGFAWLKLHPSEWPISNEEPDLRLVEAELRKTVVTCTDLQENHPFQGLLRVSSYSKIIRIMTNVIRFKRALLGRIRQASTRSEEQKDELDPVTEAENVLIKYIQLDIQQQPKNLVRLRPFEDEHGVIRTRTRLTHEDEANFKTPIILPNNNQFVALLIRWEHENNVHIGTEMLLSKLRERYWIIHGRRMIRSIINSCWICKRFLTRTLEAPEAPLPSARTELKYAFATIGVDAAGPIMLKNKSKVWFILFTCAVYRAVHLEVVESLSTDAFLRAFRDFVAKRARPQVVYSDNGLNFVGAQRAIVNVNWGEVLEYAQARQIQWRFNTPTAAWHGGFFERMIGVVKGLLKRMLGKKTVHLFELTSLCVEITEAVNNRPLTYVSEDPEDPQPLTPNHFVKNLEVSAALPEVDVIEGHHLRAAFRKVQRLREALRSRFRTEYVGQLLSNQRKTKLDMLQPKDVVLVKHEHHKRQDWQLATIIKPIISPQDGIARSYSIWMKGMETTRPIQHLCPMEMSGEAAASIRRKGGKNAPAKGAQSTSKISNKLKI